MAGTYAPMRNIFGQWKMDIVTYPASDIDTDANGDVTITFTNLRRVLEGSVQVTLEKGYVGNVQSVSGNTATIRIYKSAGSAAELAPVTSTTDVSILHAVAFGE